MKGLLACFVFLAAIYGGMAHAQSEELPASCKSLVSLGKSLIYKGCAGSGHLSKDPRGAGVALIAKKGTVLRVDRCMPILNPDDKQIGALYLYPFNDPSAYAWRGYSNYINGCGRGDTRTKIRQRAGNDPIFIRINKKAGKCIKIQKAWTNVNSVQRCDR